MNFGEIYFVPVGKADKRIAGHFVMFLYENLKTKKIYLTTLQSGIFKIFENAGTLNLGNCKNCIYHPQKAVSLRKYLSAKSYLSADITVFLNTDKYSFLNRQTFLHFKDYFLMSSFLFKSKISNGDYEKYGTLYELNRKQCVLAIRYSDGISKSDAENIILSYK